MSISRRLVIPVLTMVALAASSHGPAVLAAQPERPATHGAERVIEAAGIHPDQYGMVVRPLGRGTLEANHNGARPLNPASTMKLVTTHAAMALLGPDYRWSTSIYTTGPVVGDTMTGDLIIKGGGDPKLVIEDMTEVVAKLRLAGLREIRGDLVIDDSL